MILNQELHIHLLDNEYYQIELQHIHFLVCFSISVS